MALMQALETFHIVCAGFPLTIQKDEIWDSTATFHAVVVTTAAPAQFATFPNGTTVHRNPHDQ